MNKKNAILKTALVSIIFTVFSCGIKYGIPEKKMVAILTEMHLADGTIAVNQHVHIHGYLDSTQLYGPILDKYGYTQEDFRASLDMYLRNPKTFDDVYSKVIERLKEQQAVYAPPPAPKVTKLSLDELLNYEVSLSGDTTAVWW